MLNDLRLSLRLLRRRPLFAAATASTLAIGIGATTAVFSVFDAILLNPFSFLDPNRVVAVELVHRDGTFGLSAGAAAAVGELPAVENLAMVIGHERTFVTGGEPELVRGAGVSSGFFSVFQSPVLIGTWLSEANAGGFPIVLSEKLWRRLFHANASVIGQLVQLDDTTYSIAGVMPRSFAIPDTAEYWVPYRADARQLAEVGVGPFDVYARLTTANLTVASTQATALQGQLGGGLAEASRFRFTPLVERTGGPYRSILQLLLGVVALLLLIGCANAANLLLAQGRQREEELAVRSAIGATKMRLMRQLLSEATILAASAGAAGLFLGWLLLRLITVVAGPEFPRVDALGLNMRSAAFAVTIAAATVWFFALLPAWLTVRRPVTLHGSRHLIRRDARRTTQMLIAAEVALTLTLSIGSGLALLSLSRVLRVDLGFDPANVEAATVRPSPTRYQGVDRGRLVERVLARLRENAGVQAAAISHVPLDTRLAPRVPASGADRRVEARMRQVSRDAMTILRIPVISGRPFAAADDQTAPPAAIVNQRLAAMLWRDADPVGRTVSVGSGTQERPYTVIGVAGDIRGNLVRVPEPEIYLHHLQHVPLEMTIIARGSIDAIPVLAAVRAAVRAEDATLAVSRPRSMRGLVAAATSYRRFNTAVLALFAGAALLLSASGVLAVVMFSVAARMREFGIRAALGAARTRLVRLAVGDVVPAVAAGAAAGLAGIYNLAFLLNRRALLFNVGEVDVLTYAAATVSVLGIILIAASLPAWRAACQDPAAVLLRE